MAQTLYKAEDLYTLDGDYELDRGVLVPVMPAKRFHGRLTIRIGSRIETYAESRSLGITVADMGCILERDPDTVRAPDVAFMTAGRYSPGDPDAFLTGAPDLAVEIVSDASNVPAAIRKSSLYIEKGTRVAWIVDIERRRVLVFTDDGIARTLAMGDTLDGGDVLPGFTWPLEDIFKTP